MKKALSINISGVVFHIDEDAYEKLHRYLEAIASHFRGFEGKDEVIADIESRIAEILQKNINEAKQVITMEDVDAVIGIMGQPADYILDEDQDTARGPASYTYQTKRLYRDPDQKIIGGVCSGIASYFIIDPVWIRLLFLVLAFSGFGVMLYLILWVVVPEARTTAEKLEMRGQQVNIGNIEQSLKDEVNQLKNKINDLTGKARASYKKGRENFDLNQRDRFRDGFSSAGKLLLRILAVFAGLFIFLIGLALSIAFISVIFRFPGTALMENGEIGFFPLYPTLEMIFRNDSDLRTFSTALIVVLGIPLLLMLWGGIRLIFNLPRAKYIGGLAAFVWICGLVIALIFGMKAYNSFRYQGEFVREASFKTDQIDTIHLVTRYVLPEDLDWSNAGYFHFPEWRLVISDGDKAHYGIPRLRIFSSTDSLSRLVSVSRARGTFRDEADERAGKIKYEWQLSGDTLTFPDSFIIDENEKWRKQEMDLKLYLPEGTVFSLDENSPRILGGHSSYSRHDMAGKVFIVEREGINIFRGQ